MERISSFVPSKFVLVVHLKNMIARSSGQRNKDYVHRNTIFTERNRNSIDIDGGVCEQKKVG